MPAKFIYVHHNLPEHRRYVPLVHKIPVVRYHGIEPANLIGLQIEIYVPTGKQDHRGREMKYKGTIFHKKGGL